MKYALNLLGHELKLSNIVRAENCTLTDDKGNTYLDLESGIWSTSIGHSHKVVSEVIAKSANTFMHSGYCYNSKIVDNAAKKIAEITGIKEGKSLFLTSGSEAVDLAISLAMHVTKRKKILTLSDSYLSAFGHFTNKEEIVTYDWINASVKNEINYDQISAFVFEPGSSSGLVRFPKKEVIANIVKNVREAGGFIIANEVTTGVGRTGAWFGYNHYDLAPDIVAIGKGIGNGYPVSCVIFSPELVEKMELSHYHYGQSHQNDPMGASVALCVINQIEKDHLIDRAKALGVSLKNRLEELKRRYKVIKEIRNRGLMFAIEFHSTTERSIAQEVTDYLFLEKIIVVKRPNHEVIRLDPALTIYESSIAYFLEKLEVAIK